MIQVMLLEFIGRFKTAPIIFNRFSAPGGRIKLAYRALGQLNGNINKMPYTLNNHKGCQK